MRALGLAILLLLVLTAVLLLTRPQWGFLGAWFFGHAGNTASSLVPVFTEVGAERRSIAADDGDRRRRRPRRVMARSCRRWQRPHASAASATDRHRIIAALGAVTVRRNAEYTSNLSLWRTVVDRWPHGRARHNLAMALEGRGQVDDVMGRIASGYGRLS